MNALQAIRHVRFNPEMWAKVQPPENFIQDVKAGKLPTRLVAHPAGVLQRASRRRGVRVRRRELDRDADQRDHEERRLGVDRDRRRLGRLRRVLRPGRSAPLRHHGSRARGRRRSIISPYTRRGDNPDGGYVDNTDIRVLVRPASSSRSCTD